MYLPKDYLTVEKIISYLEENDFPIQSFITLQFGGNFSAFVDVLKHLIAIKKAKKEEIISALCAYENNALLCLKRKSFKLNVKAMNLKISENEKYQVLVSPLTSFIG